MPITPMDMAPYWTPMEVSGTLMDTSGKILFNCPSCGYRAKIPGNYLGMSIRCPGCNGAQTVVKPTDKTAETTGKTVSITRVATTPLPFTMEEAKKPSASTHSVTRTPLPGSLNALTPPSTPANQAMPSGSNAADSLLFVCTACAYRARIPTTYAGRTILCPKCSASQAAPAANAPQPPSTGGTVRIERVATTTPAFGTPALPDQLAFADSGLSAPERPKPTSASLEISEKILFTCASCGMRARLPAKYAGNTIKCPKCTKPGTVPLSDVVEAATGTTVSISRVDMAKAATAEAKGISGLASPAKRPSGEIAMPPAAQPSKRPSGEIAASSAQPSAQPMKRASGEFEIENNAPAAETSPFQGQAIVGDAAMSGAGDDDLLEDLRSKPKAQPEAKKGGVVKRRGSSSHLPSQSEPAKAPAQVAKPNPVVASKPQPVAAKAKPIPATKTPTPKLDVEEIDVDGDDDAEADAEAAVAAKAAARKPSRSNIREADGAPAARSSMLPMALMGAVVLLLATSTGLFVAWHGSKGELAELTTKYEQTAKNLDAAKLRADKADSDNLKLRGDLDAQKKEADTLKEQSDKLAAEAKDLKQTLDTQKADFDKKVADLEAKVTEQARQIEAATQGFKAAKPGK